MRPPDVSLKCSAVLTCDATRAQVLGQKRKHLSGFSSATQELHQGFVYGCDVIQNTPPALRAKAARMVGGKCTLLARIDAYGQDPSGSAGAAMKVLWRIALPACSLRNSCCSLCRSRTWSASGTRCHVSRAYICLGWGFWLMSLAAICSYPYWRLHFLSDLHRPSLK